MKNLKHLICMLLLASAVGFGIGHGIQGRYNDKGWIFN